MPQYPDLQLYVAGEWKSRDGAPVINPADESDIATVPHATRAVPAKGARIVTGGSRIGNRGYFYPLTVLADVPDDARAMHEEPFGPLVLLSRVGTLDEAIEKANSLPYGLAAYAFCRSTT